MPFANPNTRVEIATNEEELAILRGTRKLLTPHDHWTKRAFRRTTVKFGWFRTKTTASFCMLGAMSEVTGVPPDELVLGPCGNVVGRLQAMAGVPIAIFNDRPTTRHGDVLSLLDRAYASFE